ncbi:MAG TPA: hypothetical protein VJP04_05455 [Terriglobales bacterium]|nr:hypothetical protein [Terriglobales bacterium]
MKSATSIEQQVPLALRIGSQQIVEAVAVEVSHGAARGKVGVWCGNRRQAFHRDKIRVAAIQQHLRTICRPQDQIEFAVVVEIGNLRLRGGNLLDRFAARAEARTAAIDVELRRAVVAQHQQVGERVVSEIGEQRASRTPDSAQARGPGDVCESSVAIVAIKVTGGASEVLRKAKSGLLRRMRQIGVHADEQVEQPVIVRVEEQRLGGEFPGRARQMSDGGSIHKRAIALVVVYADPA